ncbi:MAG: hypothetical protein PUD22_08255 [Erysipelotrichaceae bacterium]|nr:hypothetical protein [Erysipelotrichaceae bacterium]
METFEEILASYLEAFEQHPDQDVEQLIAQKATEHGLSDKGRVMLQKTSEYLDDFQQKVEEIAEAKKSKIGLNTWFSNNLDQSLDGLDEEQKSVMCDTLLKQMTQQTKRLIAEEESHGKS